MAGKPKPPLSEWIIAHRKERGESVADIARITDRSEATVRGWEAGRPPQPDDPVIAHLERHWEAIAPRASASADSQALIRAMTEALLAQTRALTDLRTELADIRATMTDARAAALGERQAMTDMLEDLAARLHALQVHAGIATVVSDQG